MTTRPGDKSTSDYGATLEQVHRGLNAAHAQMERVLTQLDRLQSDMRAMTEAVMNHTEAINTAVLRAEAIALRTEAKGDPRTMRMNLLAEIGRLRNELKAEFVASNMEVATRFGTVDMRLDTVDETLNRVERDIGDMRLDVLRIETGLITTAHAQVQDSLGSAGADIQDARRVSGRNS
jgi:hypothetical protein